MHKKNVLYISLTGMTEPLGRSQVLEYLIDLGKENNIYLISFEREQDLDSVSEIQALVDEHNIKWTYLVYSNKHGVFSSILQIFLAIRLGSKIIKTHTIDIVHARSMIPATMGLVLKKMYGVKLLFDIRGFSIDEKVDSGRLQKGSLFFKILKKLDNYLYRASDHIVTLTHAAKEILHQSLTIPNDKVTVIPTCANKSVFKVLNEADKQTFKDSLGYGQDIKLILHTGTVSGWYDFESEVKLIKEMMKQDRHIHFLVLNKNEHTFIEKVFDTYQLPADRVKISSSSFDNVHKYLNIADMSVFFIRPSYSKQASAPTKFAENVACYLPSVSNLGVGDMGFYMQQYDVGCMIDLDQLKDDCTEVARMVLGKINQSDFTQTDFSALFDQQFDKKIAIESYQKIYNGLI